MSNFAIMTQDNCRNCEHLKLMLKKPMKGKYDDRIEFVHRQENEDRFIELVSRYPVQATPTIINLDTGETWTDMSSGPKIAKFLEA